MRLVIFVFLAFLVGANTANAASLSLTGHFSSDDQVQLFRLTVSNPAKMVTVRTTSSAYGGFDPMLALFDNNGVWLDFNDDDPNLLGGTDSALLNLLGPGIYTVALSQFDNNNIGALSEGFTRNGQTSYTSTYGCANGLFCGTGGDDRTNFWSLEFEGARSIERITAISSIPLPATLPLFGAGIAALYVIRRKFHSF